MNDIVKAVMRYKGENKGKISIDLLKYIDDIDLIIDLALYNGVWCDSVRKRIYNLSKKEDSTRLFKDILNIQVANPEYSQTIYPSRNDKPLKGVDTLDIKSIGILIKNECIITDFGCDSGFVYFTKEGFKSFTQESIEAIL